MRRLGDVFAMTEEWIRPACLVGVRRVSGEYRTYTVYRTRTLHTLTHDTFPPRATAPLFYVRLSRTASDFFNPSKSNTDCSIR